ncbi:hypothetical protein NC651_011275 [Populus alba x Populus x berolinensis]|nr:hypothetical protein NC651_011275 [Populus alba x Populus x berolinensis]
MRTKTCSPPAYQPSLEDWGTETFPMNRDHSFEQRGAQEATEVESATQSSSSDTCVMS